MQGVEILLLFGEHMMVILLRSVTCTFFFLFFNINFFFKEFLFILICSWLHLRIICSSPVLSTRLCEFGISEGAISALTISSC